MANIINFQEYVDAENQERKRIKKLSTLTAKKDAMLELLCTIDDCVGASLLTKQVNEFNQVAVKENIIDGGLLDIFASSVQQYIDDIDYEIFALENTDYEN